jgi:RND family efflux transporter MFP subunit
MWSVNTRQSAKTSGTASGATEVPQRRFSPWRGAGRLAPGLLVLVGLLVLGAAILLFRSAIPLQRVSGDSAVLAVTVQRRDFVETIRLAGTTNALHSQSILAPTLAGAQLGTLTITRLVAGGTRVKQGQLLVEFDRQEQYKNYLDKLGTYHDLANQVAGKQAAEEAARAKDDADLKQAEDALATAKLEVKKDAIVSRIDAEINQEKLQEAEATLKQLRQTYALKRQAAAADIQTLKIQEQRALQTMQYAQTNARKMIVQSPMAGVVVLNTIWLNGRMGQVQPGSQIRPGVPFLRVVDPSAMDVRTEVNQADLPYLRVGQSAEVSLDAYPGLHFPGTLESLAPLGHPGQFSDKVRTFTAVFLLQGSNPKLMPDLSAAVDVELAARKNALVVPRQCIAREKSGSYVWMKSGSGFEKHAVRLGPENDLDVVIESGLKAGDVVRENANGSGGDS